MHPVAALWVGGSILVLLNQYCLKICLDQVGDLILKLVVEVINVVIYYGCFPVLVDVG